MTANCLGSFGTYQYVWSRHFNEANPDANRSKETVWVTKRYIPTDLRVSAPVPIQKLMAPDVKELPRPADHWLLPRLESKSNRLNRERYVYTSQPSTRCEEWSTLRQMLPSAGGPVRIGPQNWGSGASAPPNVTPELNRRFPHINSPMTRYVDDMHLTNRLFKLH